MLMSAGVAAYHMHAPWQAATGPWRGCSQCIEGRALSLGNACIHTVCDPLRIVAERVAAMVQESGGGTYLTWSWCGHGGPPAEGTRHTLDARQAHTLISVWTGQQHRSMLTCMDSLLVWLHRSGLNLQTAGPGDLSRRDPAAPCVHVPCRARCTLQGIT